MDMIASKTSARIEAIVVKLLEKRAPGGGALGPMDDLRAAGLTSLDMVNLMLAVEEAFDILIPQPRMTPDNFRSIAAIGALVDDLSPR